MQSKIERCAERDDGDKKLSPKEIKRMIKRIEKNRARTRYIIADGKWGDRKSYNMIINTTGWDIKRLAKSLAPFVESWFESPTT